MRNHSKPRFAAAVVLSMVLLAGCTTLPGRDNRYLGENNAEEVSQPDLGVVLQQEIGRAASSLEQTVETTALHVGENVMSRKISESLSVSNQIGSSTVLNLDNPVGKIEVLPVSSDQINVKVTLWFDDSSAHEAHRQSIIDNAEVSIEISGEKIKVFTHAKNKPNQDLWDWAQDKYGYSNFIIDYIVEVPDHVDMFQITNNVGEVRLQDLKGTYRIVSNVGTVHISGATITGKSTVESNTGSIHLDIADMVAGSSLKAKTDIGSLHTVLSNTLKCSLEIKSELGMITGAASGKSELNGGGPLLSLTSSIGAITVGN